MTATSMGLDLSRVAITCLRWLWLSDATGGGAVGTPRARVPNTPRNHKLTWQYPNPTLLCPENGRQ